MVIQTKIGDIFAAQVSSDKKKYIQYIGSDITQLSSDVIRAFATEYPLSSEIDLDRLLSDRIDFYAHCVTKLGIQQGFWQKVGNSSNLGDASNVHFRTPDGADMRVEFSQDWWVWKIGQDMKHIGRLSGELLTAEIGSVIPPDSIVYRLRTGKYDFVYPQIG